jgi:hypothetical protein
MGLGVVIFFVCLCISRRVQAEAQGQAVDAVSVENKMSIFELQQLEAIKKNQQQVIIPQTLKQQTVNSQPMYQSAPKVWAKILKPCTLNSTENTLNPKP